MLKHDRLPELEDEVRELCQEIIDDPLRSEYISVGRTHEKIKEDYPDDPRDSLRQALGIVFRDAEFLEKWSDLTFKIVEDEL